MNGIGKGRAFCKASWLLLFLTIAAGFFASAGAADAAAPDLTVTSVNAAPTLAKPGDFIGVSWTIKNQGSASSGSLYNRVSLGVNPYGTGILLGNYPMNSIASGSSSSDAQVPRIPADTAPGYYYVTVFTDAFQSIAESDENNNINKAPNQIYISGSASVPSPPRNLRVTETGNGFVKIAWDPPSSNGGSVITDYKIYRGTSSGGETYRNTIASDWTTYNNNAGVTNGVRYYYVVTAVNSAGESGFSNEVDAIPQATTTAPVVETRDVTSVTGASAVINGAIVSDGGGTIDERRFDWGLTSSCSDDWTRNVTISGSSFSYTLTGLQPGKTYYFRAWAHNSAGWSHGNVLSFTTSTSQCSSGPCCDTTAGRFRSSDYKCQEDVTTDYGCPWGTGCGADVGVRHQDRYCSGSSAQCDGVLQWDVWTAAADCPSSYICVDDSPTCAYQSSCAVGKMIVRVPQDFPSISQAVGWISGFGKPGIVLVSPGTYNEPHLRMKENVDIIGADRATTIIEGSSDYVIECANNARLSGFTIRGGFVGIRCDGTSPTISNNIIKGNGEAGATGVLAINGASPVIRNNLINDATEGVYAVGSSPTIQNNIISTGGAANIGIDLTESSSATITNNVIDSKGPSPWGWGIYLDSSTSAVIKNNIFTNMPCAINDPYKIMISYYPAPINDWVVDSRVAYNDFWNVNGEICSGSGYWSPPLGTGQKAVNPSFVDASNYDFRLQDGSQCIDSGDPAASYNDAYFPPSKGASRNDMGAYGGPYGGQGNTPPVLAWVRASPSSPNAGATVTITSSAGDPDWNNIRLVCGTSPGASDLCTGSYASSNPSCSFTSPWTDTNTRTLYCRVYDGSSYSNEKTDNALSDNTLRCSDGTEYGSCSATKPKYCENGNIVNNCQVCGCPSGQGCQADGSCRTISCTPGTKQCMANILQTCGSDGTAWLSQDCGIAAYCSSGSCANCPAGTASCNQNPSDGCEISLLTDNNNCGSCGNVCSSGEICENGQCNLQSGNHPPNPPSNLGQFKSDRTTPIPTGAVTYEKTVVFSGDLSDPDGDSVKLEIELRLTYDYSGGFLFGRTHWSDLVNSGGHANAPAEGLPNGRYHWQARVVDEHGLASAWVEFGGNARSAADFTVRVDSMPFATFTYSPMYPDVGQAISFDASASYDPDGGPISSYRWDFEDGVVKFGKTVSYIPQKTGARLVFLTVTDNEGTEGGHFRTIDVFSKELENVIEETVGDTKNAILDIFDTTSETFLAADYLMGKCKEDLGSVMGDVVGAVFKLSTLLPGVQKVLAFVSTSALDKLPAELAEILKSSRWAKPLSEKVIEKGIEVATSDITQRILNAGSIDAALSPALIASYRNQRDNLTVLKNEVLNNIAALGLTNEEINLYKEDLKMRSMGNRFAKEIFEKKASIPIALKNMDIDYKLSWQFIFTEVGFGVIDVLSFVSPALPVKILSTGISSGKIIEKLFSFLSRDARGLAIGIQASNSGFTQLQYVSSNTFEGLWNINNKVHPDIVRGEIVSVEHFMEGFLNKERMHYNLYPSFLYKNFYSEVKINNTGDVAAIYTLVADTPSWGIISLPFIDTQQEQIEPGQTKTFTVFYKKDWKGIDPRGKAVSFTLLGEKFGEGGGVYGLALTIITPGTTKIVLNNVSVSDEELENAAAYPYPVKSDITNLFDNSSADYSLNIYVENPFEFPVQARLTQGMPQNVSIISAGNGTVDGNNVSWQLELQPDERDMLNVTLNFGSLRKAEITGALLEIYDQVQDNWNAFASDNMTVYLVVLSGDVTRDFRVDIFDLASVGLAFGSSLGEANWNPNADLNGDSVINIFDLATVGLNYGKTC